MRRILYVQYATPGAYPPIRHSARILSGAGWHVRMLGRPIAGVESLEFDEATRADVRLLGGPVRGPLLKLHYLGFVLWALWHAVVWRPRWLYVSDSMAAPVGLLARTLLPGVGVLFHEHDEPSARSATLIQRVVDRARRILVRRAHVVVVPNAVRAARLAEAAHTDRRVDVVWNCPTLDEVRRPEPQGSALFRAIYLGSVNEARLPLSLVDALVEVPDVELVVVGYETSPGYLDRVREHAARAGVAGRVTLVGTVPRHEVLDICATCDAGLLFLQRGFGDDANQLTMVGASNKAFDYLACGIPFLVADLPDLVETFVEPGYAVACDPRDAGSIARALARLAHDREATRRMGERGRQRVLAEWNYEAQFARVRSMLEARAA